VSQSGKIFINKKQEGLDLRWLRRSREAWENGSKSYSEGSSKTERSWKNGEKMNSRLNGSEGVAKCTKMETSGMNDLGKMENKMDLKPDGSGGVAKRTKMEMNLIEYLGKMEKKMDSRSYGSEGVAKRTKMEISDLNNFGKMERKSTILQRRFEKYFIHFQLKMDDVILNHLAIASREKFLSVSKSSPPFIIKREKLLFDEKSYYFQGNNTGIIFISGEQEGFEMRWWEDGNKSYELPWKNGREDGFEIEWYWNGNKKHEIPWKNGLQDGLEVGWNQNGDIWYERFWKNGEEVSEVTR
jgi:hypothetical protein